MMTMMMESNVLKMMTTGTRFRLFLFGLVAFVNCIDLPSSLKTCQRKDVANFDECVLVQGKTMYGVLLNGYPELGVPSFKPLQLHNFTISNGINGLTVNAINAEMRGFKDGDLKDLKVDMIKRTITMQFRHNIVMASKYRTYGRLLQFPVNNKGNMEVSARGLDWSLYMKWDLIRGNDNRNYMKVKKSRGKYELDLAQFKFDGFLNKDIDIGMNRLLNEHWRDIVKELGDPSLQVLQKKYTDIVNNILLRVPFEDMFP